MWPGRYLQQIGSRLTTKDLGCENVEVGDVRSYSQDGDHRRPMLDPATGDVLTIGPNKLWPNARVRKRRLLGSTFLSACLIVVVFGQSVANAASPTTTIGDVDDQGGAFGGSYSVRAILPGKLFVPSGGSIPSPEGGGSPSADTLWPPEVYADAVPAKEGINYLRTPGREQYREIPGLTACLHLADALDDSSCVLFINGASGSTDFRGNFGARQNIEGWTYFATGGTGNGPRLRYDVVGPNTRQVGDTFTLTSASPSGGNVAGALIVAADADTITVDHPGPDPGAWSSGGSFSGRAYQLQNVRKAAIHLAGVMAARGYSVRLFACLYAGHEGEADCPTYAVFEENGYDYIRAEMDDLGATINGAAPTPYIVPVQVAYPRFDWRDPAERIGEASWWNLGWLKVKRTAHDPKCHPVPIYFADQADRSANYTGPHFGSRPSMRWGAKVGNVLVDIAEGTAIDPPGVLTASRTANSTAVTTTTTGTFAVETTEVTDPGGNGLQYFSSDADISIAGSFSQRKERAYTETTVTATSVGATIGATLASAPDPRRNLLGVAFKHATQTKAWCGRGVTGVSYDADADVVSLALDGDCALTVGTEFSIFNVYGSGIVSDLVAVAGTGGTALKYASVTDPTGAFTAGGFVINAAEFAVGNTRGNRAPLALATTRHWSLLDGAPLPDYICHDLVAVHVDPSGPGLIDQEAELRGLMSVDPVPQPAILFDVADNRSFSVANTQRLFNQGSSGTTDDVYNGDGSGSDSHDLVPSGVYNSKKRDGYLVVAAATTGCLSPVGTPSVGANMHKAWSEANPNYGKGWGTFEFTYWQGANPQYLWTTGAIEGSIFGPASCLRVASHKPQLLIRNAANSTVWDLTSTIAALTNGAKVVVTFYFRAGGRAWLWVNDTITYDNVATFTSPSAAAAQDTLRFGRNSPLASATRLLVPGFELHAWMLHDQSTRDLEPGDLEPYHNGAMKRHVDNAYA